MKPWLLIALKKEIKISKSFAQKMFRDLEEKNVLFSTGSDKIKLEIVFSAFPNVTTIFFFFFFAEILESLKLH